MPQPVFISYARKTNQANARALRDALGADVCFLDEEDIELGAKFPKLLTDALLGARVIVVFADAAYFQRWYCLREWMLARAPFDQLLKRGTSPDRREAALDHVVIALAENVDGVVLRHLPPPMASGNWPSARDTTRLAALVRQKLAADGTTLRERCDYAGVPSSRIDAMVDESAMPPARNVAGIPMHPSLPQSLREGFVGRVDDLWRLHVALTEPRLGSQQIAALTGAVQGGGGFGKTQLALEYVHRFGPTDFRGGLFWIDATEAEPLERQFHGVLRALCPEATPSIEAMREEGRDVRGELEQALDQSASSQSILFVVDNVPEPQAGVAPRRLDQWCPALGKVTCLATSRKRLDHDASIERIDVDVLAADAAVALLTLEVPNERRRQGR